VSSSVATNAFISGELTEANQLYLFAIEIAQHLGKAHLIAAYSNNLGVIYLLEGKFNLAETSLMAALKTNEQHARITGTALSLNNLMLMYALQENWKQFERVMYRAERTTRSLSSNDIAKYNDWVMFLYQLRNSDKVTNSAIKNFSSSTT